MYLSVSVCLCLWRKVMYMLNIWLLFVASGAPDEYSANVVVWFSVLKQSILCLIIISSVTPCSSLKRKASFWYHVTITMYKHFLGTDIDAQPMENKKIFKTVLIHGLTNLTFFFCWFINGFVDFINQHNLGWTTFAFKSNKLDS